MMGCCVIEGPNFRQKPSKGSSLCHGGICSEFKGGYKEWHGKVGGLSLWSKRKKTHLVTTGNNLGVWKHWGPGDIEIPHAVSQPKLIQAFLGIFVFCSQTTRIMGRICGRSKISSGFVKSGWSPLYSVFEKYVYSPKLFWFERNSLMPQWDTFYILILHLDLSTFVVWLLWPDGTASTTPN